MALTMPFNFIDVKSESLESDMPIQPDWKQKVKIKLTKLNC